ncbi:MAG TPA: HD domain-containing phosphohydrolase [bacterium]
MAGRIGTVGEPTAVLWARLRGVIERVGAGRRQPAHAGDPGIAPGGDAAQEAERQRAIAEALRDTAEALIGTLDRDELLDRILGNLGRVLPHDAATIMLTDEAAAHVVRVVGHVVANPSAEEIEQELVVADYPTLAQMRKTLRPVIIDDTTRSEEWVRAPADAPARSYLGVPLRARNEVVGFLNLVIAVPGFYTPEHAAQLQAFADQAALAIATTKLHVATAQRLERLAALRAIDIAISTSLDLRVILDVLLDQVTTHLSVDAAVVLLLNPQTQLLTYTATRGFRAPQPNYTVRVGQGVAGRAVLERRTVGYRQVAEAEELTALMHEEGFAAVYAAPLVAKGRVQGVLEIFHRSPLAPDQEWLDFFEALAGQAAIAIDNAALFGDLQRANLDLTLAYDTTLEGWSRAMDLRDKETEGHTQRVTEMTERLARAIGIADAELVHIRRGALLHDIGKMGIPDAVLLKPGPLSDQEWQKMRRHPEYAYELLSPIAYLRPAIDIPYAHHERWDGKGYPRGLRGAQIPLAARIFAVVDVWDALTSDRPYRPAWSGERALAYIQAEAGEQFDPEVVRAFVELRYAGQLTGPAMRFTALSRQGPPR